MKRAVVIAIVSLVIATNAQNVLTGKEIYRVNCGSVVQIRTNEGFGVGFITSRDGVIVTANHVVTTRESHFRQYASDIKVWLDGKASPYLATPLTGVSDDQVNYDVAVLKIGTTGLTPVAIGDWTEVDVGDNLIVIPSFPGLGCILLSGTVAAKGNVASPLGPKPVKTIIFQSPIRNGFSGAPIFSSKGRVIGIEDTKVFGITPALDEERTNLEPNRFTFAGTDLGRTMIDLINNLDQNLISGLGSGVAIEYANHQQQKEGER